MVKYQNFGKFRPGKRVVLGSSNSKFVALQRNSMHEFPYIHSSVKYQVNRYTILSEIRSAL